MSEPIDKSVSIISATSIGLVIAVLCFAVFDFGYAIVLSSDPPLRAVIAFPLPQVIATFAVLVIAHEAIHGLTWAFLNRHRAAFRVKYGVQWRYLMPYASPIGPMPAFDNRIGGLAPAVLLGLVPLLYGVLAANAVVAGWAIIMVAASAGDFLIVWQLRGTPGWVLVEDRADRVGVIVRWDLSTQTVDGERL